MFLFPYLSLMSLLKNNLIPYLKIFLGIILSSLSYTLIPLWFLKYIPNEAALGVSSQYQFLSLILGIFQEIFSLMTISLLGKKKSKQYIKIFFLVILSLGLFSSFIFFILVETLCSFWQVPNEILGLTINFFKVSALSIPFLFLNSFLLVIVSNLNVNSYLNVKIFNFILCILINFFLFYPSFLSLSLGDKGLGFNYLLQSMITFIYLFYLFRVSSFYGQKVFSWKGRKKEIKNFFRFFISSSCFIILASTLRNFSYSYLFLKPLNNLGTIYSSSWFLNSSIFWSIYLIPFLALSQFLQIKVLNYKKEEMDKFLIFKAYKRAFLINIFLIILTFIFYKVSFNFFLNRILSLSEIENLSFYKDLSEFFFFAYSLYSFSFLLRVFFYIEGLIGILSLLTILSNLFLFLINFLFFQGSFDNIKLLFYIDLLLEVCILFLYLFLKIKNKYKSIDTFTFF